MAKQKEEWKSLYNINGKLVSLEEWIEYIHKRHAELMKNNNKKGE